MSDQRLYGSQWVPVRLASFQECLWKIVIAPFARFSVGYRETCKLPGMSVCGMSDQRLHGSQWVPVSLQTSRNAVLRDVRSMFAWFPVGSREISKILRMSLEGCCDLALWTQSFVFLVKSRFGLYTLNEE